MLKTFSGRRASQREDELRPFIDLLTVERDCRSYLEIGARHGDTFHEVMCSLPEGSKGVAVDLPGANWGIDSSRACLERACADLTLRGYDVQMIFGNSQSAVVRDLVFAYGPFDAVLIDGDHLYEGVKADFENYRRIAPLIAFHDIAGEGQATRDKAALPVEVPQFWAEVRDSFPCREIVGASRGMGIGVLFP